MADQLRWGEATSIAWGNLTGLNDGRSAQGVRLLFFALFLGGALWAGYAYYQLQLLREVKEFVPTADAGTIAVDKKRLDNMMAEVRSASSLRSNSFVWAQSMKDVGKYAFDGPRGKTVAREVSPVEAVSVPEVIFEPPPDIVVRAIMVAGKQRTAVMDISGVGRGMIVRQGDTFIRKKGRIVRIAPDKVTVRWDGRNWDIAPGF